VCVGDDLLALDGKIWTECSLERFLVVFFKDVFSACQELLHLGIDLGYKFYEQGVAGLTEEAGDLVEW
jgi:hypothetical protein